MTQWYYADADGVRQGPVEAEALLAQYAAGAVQAQTLVWREGLSGWQPLASVAGEVGLAHGALPEMPTAGIDPAVAAAPAPSAHIQYAGFWRRMAASIIDGFAVGLLAMPITLPIAIGFGAAMAHGEESGAAAMGPILLQVLLQLISVGLTVVYFSCFHASRLMATPGKLAVGIKVVRADGQRLGFGHSLGRAFAYYLSVLTLYIGFLAAAFTQRKQGLHDLVCDTLVVDRWAFTDSPQRQQAGLDTVTIVILAVYGGLMLLVLLAVLAVVAVLIATGLH
ncbi:MAG TPA: RDD family protein [Stenotrophomonas sp.]|nr:RDD family protein [Stenotrophomonas sp.]